MEELRILAHGITGGCLVLYFGTLFACRLPVLTFTTVNLMAAMLLGGLASFDAAQAVYLRPELQRGFDGTLFALYLAFQVLVTFGAILGQFLGSRYHIEMRSASGARTGFWVLLGAVFGYVILYWIWLENLPLFSLMGGKITAHEAAALRIHITHTSSVDAADVPILFRYWRNVTQYWSTSLLFVLLIGQQIGWFKRKRILVLGWLAFTILCLTFTLEKAYVVQLVFGLLLFRQFVGLRRISLGPLLFTGCAMVALSVGLVHWFLNYESSSGEVLRQRLAIQTASTYLQIEEAHRSGPLGLRVIPFPFRSMFLGAPELPLSSQAFARMFPEEAAQGNIGSAGGLSLVELYIGLGWPALGVFAIAITVAAAIDAALVRTFRKRRLGLAAMSAIAGWYVMFATMFSLTFLTSIFQVFGLPFLLSPQAVIVLSPLLLLVQPWTLRIRRG